jgi:hypothetical protein
MADGLIAPLSPQEEIALRRIAHGSFVVDAQVASRLIAHALIQRVSNGLRLTPLGRLRFNALPKAPLLSQQRSIHAITGYVEGLIEKAQSRVANQQAHAESSPQPSPARISSRASLLLEAQDGEADRDALSIYHPIYFFFDCEQWKSRAECALARTRRTIMEHRQRQVRLCDASDRRIECSRSLLKASVPVRPSWLDAGR